MVLHTASKNYHTRMKNTPNRTRTNGLLGRLLLLAAICSSSSCASFVDAPPAPPLAPVTDVRTFYQHVDHSGDSLFYSIRDSSLQDHHYFRLDTAIVVTQGQLTSKQLQQLPSYTMPYGSGFQYFRTNFAKRLNHPATVGADTLFAINSEKAYSVSWYKDSQHGGSVVVTRWLDLQQPLKDGATWSFFSGRTDDTVTAKVTLFDFTVSLEGTTYSHVTEVTYALHPHDGSDDHLLVVKWFAKDIGLIRSISYETAYVNDRRLYRRN